MERTTNLNSKEGRYSFPVHLLDCTDEERKSYFHNYAVQHNFLRKAIDETVSFITSQVCERLVFVCGPSGVGKKELIKGVKMRLTELASQKLIDNRGCIPVVDVEAIPPIQGSFNYDNLWIDTLLKMGETMIGNKIVYKEEKGGDSLGRIVTFSNTQKPSSLRILQNALKHREVLALIINEAHNMLKVTGGKKVNWSVDLIKALTNLSQTPIVLVGTYDLTTFLDDLNFKSTDQINQRTRIVHFPRYHKDKDNEIKYFGKNAKELLLHMPLQQTAENLLDKDWEYFYKYSLGCIGSLKIWLMDAYSLALELQAKALTIEHLEATRISGHRCEGMLESIIKGEKQMAIIQSEGKIENKLGFIEPSSESTSNAEMSDNKVRKKRKNNPFESNPKRNDVMHGRQELLYEKNE